MSTGLSLTVSVLCMCVCVFLSGGGQGGKLVRIVIGDMCGMLNCFEISVLKRCVFAKGFASQGGALWCTISCHRASLDGPSETPRAAASSSEL